VQAQRSGDEGNNGGNLLLPATAEPFNFRPSAQMAWVLCSPSSPVRDSVMHRAFSLERRIRRAKCDMLRAGASYTLFQDVRASRPPINCGTLAR
jgi:hypothetical protein